MEPERRRFRYWRCSSIRRALRRWRHAPRRPLLEGVAQLFVDVDLFPADELRHHGDASLAAQVGTGDGHADRAAAAVFVDQAPGVGDKALQHGGGACGRFQLLIGLVQKLVFDVEDAHAVRAAGDLDADHVEVLRVEPDADGTAAQIALQCAGLGNDAGGKQIVDDIGDRSLLQARHAGKVRRVRTSSLDRMRRTETRLLS